MIASCNISDFSQRISIDEVENNPFYNKLVFCIGAIYHDISDVHKGEEDIFKYLKPNEAYINDIFMMCRSMEHVWILSIMPLILFLIMDPKITVEKILSLLADFVYTIMI